MSRQEILEDIRNLEEEINDLDVEDMELLDDMLAELGEFAVDHSRARTTLRRLAKHTDKRIADGAREQLAAAEEEKLHLEQQTEFVDLPLTGIAHTQKWLKRCRAGQEVLLQPDPANPHDKNAIRVVAYFKRLFGRSLRQIGWVPRATAARVVGRISMNQQARIERTWLNTSGLTGCSITFTASAKK